MSQVRLFLVSLMLALATGPVPCVAQVAKSQPAWSPRRASDGVRLASGEQSSAAESNVAGGPLKPATDLRWRSVEPSYDKLAQLPSMPPEGVPPGYTSESPAPPYTPPPPYTTAPPYTPAPGYGPSPGYAPPAVGLPPGGEPAVVMPPNGFTQQGPPSWTAPGYWQPNPMMGGEPDCPPWPGGPYGYGAPYGYGMPCPQPPYGQVPYGQVPIVPMPVPPQQPAVEQTPLKSTVPLLPPNILGSQFGAESRMLTVSFDYAFHTRGTIISGSPGSPAAVLGYERNGGFPNDFFSVPGTGRDQSGDGFTDTFDMTEPLPPNEVPTSPGPGYEYDGGTVVYTNSPTLTTPQDGQFQDNQLWYAQYGFSKQLEIAAAGALSVRRMYVSQNNSPIPRNRVFFDYRNFTKARPNLGDVQWITLGIEKTFNSQMGSIETRLPFAYTLDNEIFEDDPITKSTEFGNITFTLKHIFWGNERWMITGGAGASIPTGADTRVFLSDGTEVLVLENDAVHIQPFLAGLWLPEEHFFVQSFMSVDYDTNGNKARGSVNGGRLPSIGEVRSATLFIGDLGAGYWIYTNPSFRAATQGIAAVGELQYQTTLDGTSAVSGNGLTLPGVASNTNTFSGTLGLHGYFFNQLAISGGVGLPISSGDKKEYDVNAIFMANWHF